MGLTKFIDIKYFLISLVIGLLLCLQNGTWICMKWVGDN